MTAEDKVNRLSTREPLVQIMLSSNQNNDDQKRYVNLYTEISFNLSITNIKSQTWRKEKTHSKCKWWISCGIKDKFVRNYRVIRKLYKQLKLKIRWNIIISTIVYMTAFLPVVSDEELMLSLPREVSFIGNSIISLASELRIEE